MLARFRGYRCGQVGMRKQRRNKYAGPLRDAVDSHLFCEILRRAVSKFIAELHARVESRAMRNWPLEQ